jgi:uncharacterized protein
MKRWGRTILLVCAALAAAAAGCLGYAYFIEPSQLVVTEATIKIDRWNPAFDGLRIALIGDIHGGSNNVTKEKLQRVVALTNAQNPDLIVMLGDYVSEDESSEAAIRERRLNMPVAEIADGLSGLKATYGVFVVLGNHDGFYGDDRVAAEFLRVGYRVLQHDIAVIENDGARLRIFGMIDHLSLPPNWVAISNEAKALLEASGSGDVIVLQHSPDILPVISGELSISPELRLMLAAHTHGGQVRFPLIGAPIVPSSYGQKYVRGHIRENDIDMFVTSGVGTSVLPVRFGVPPEIAVLTIRSD